MARVEGVRAEAVRAEEETEEGVKAEEETEVEAREAVAWVGEESSTW